MSFNSLRFCRERPYLHLHMHLLAQMLFLCLLPSSFSFTFVLFSSFLAVLPSFIIILKTLPVCLSCALPLPAAPSRLIVSPLPLSLCSPSPVRAYHVSQQGLTALHYASAEGHMEIAQLLVDMGADINMKGDVSIETDEMTITCRRP